MQVSSSEQPQKMKFKIIFLCLVFFFSFSLVSGFIESEPIHLNMDFSSPQNGENSIIEITINETGIETNETDNSDSDTETFGGNSVNKRDTNSNPPEQNTDDGSTATNGEDETLDSTSGEPKEKKGFFPRITGAVTGALGTGGTIGVFVFVLGIVGTFIVLRFKKRK